MITLVCCDKLQQYLELAVAGNIELNVNLSQHQSPPSPMLALWWKTIASLSRQRRKAWPSHPPAFQPQHLSQLPPWAWSSQFHGYGPTFSSLMGIDMVPSLLSPFPCYDCERRESDRIQLRESKVEECVRNWWAVNFTSLVWWGSKLSNEQTMMCVWLVKGHTG